MANALLRNYLAWQGEIGCDEVILPHPLVRKTASVEPARGRATIPPGAHAETGPAFQHAQAFQPTSASNLFGDLARALESKQGSANTSRPSDGMATGRALEAQMYPAFTSLTELWEYLEKQARTVFASESEISLLRGAGPVQAPLALVSLQPNESDLVEHCLFSGPAGVLLEKMMRAIKLDYTGLYRTSLMKHLPSNRIFSRREMTRILPILHAELGLGKVPMVLLLGEACAQAVLKTTKNMEELRQIPHREGNRDFVVTYHPDDLLRKDELKRKAWEDLQWLQRRMNQMEAQA